MERESNLEGTVADEIEKVKKLADDLSATILVKEARTYLQRQVVYVGRSNLNYDISEPSDAYDEVVTKIHEPEVREPDENLRDKARRKLQEIHSETSRLSVWYASGVALGRNLQELDNKVLEEIKGFSEDDGSLREDARILYEEAVSSSVRIKCGMVLGTPLADIYGHELLDRFAGREEQMGPEHLGFVYEFSGNPEYRKKAAKRMGCSKLRILFHELFWRPKDLSGLPL